MIIENRSTKDSKEVIIGQNSKKFIIVHDTGSPGNSTLERILRFFQRSDYLSTHLIVGRNGMVSRYVEDNDVAFHAGVSEWKGQTRMNYHSIGIEVVSDGYDFTDDQREALVELCRLLMNSYDIPAENVLRHADVAPGRKRDIGVDFYAPRWGTWKKFQMMLEEKPDYQKEVADAQKFVKDNRISNGERPEDPISRKEAFVMLHRFWKKFKG